MDAIKCLKSHTELNLRIFCWNSWGRLPGVTGVCGKPKPEAGHLFQPWVPQEGMGDRKNNEGARCFLSM